MTQTPPRDRPPQDRVDTENLRDFGGLRRSLTDRKVAGVAGGLGRHLNVDPTVLRVAFVVLCLFGGAGFVLYGAAWLFVPEEGSDKAAVTTNPHTRKALLVAAAVVAGLLLVGDSWGGLWFPWPLAVVALVVVLVLLNRDRYTRSQPPAGQWPGDDTGHRSATRHAPRPDRGPRLFWVALPLLAIALGTLGVYDVSGGWVTEAAYPALALTVVGAMLVLGAWVGRPGGLIALGLVAAVALVVTSTVAPGWQGDRRVHVVPPSAGDVGEEYYVPAGRIHLDLTRVTDLQALDGRAIDLEANAGELVVTVPDGLAVDVRADISVAGSVRLDGYEEGGPDVFVDQRIPAPPGAPEVELNLDLVVGSIEVRRP
jgi:phage shock protein PspC (stress-responsive transcriptional regulator)